jgi:hypothetical protein
VDTETVPAAAPDDFVVSSTVPEPVDEPTTPAEPVDALAETDDEHVDSEQPEPDASSDAGKALAKKKGSLQARINELTREKHATRREADAARAEAAAMRQRLEALERGGQAQPPSGQQAPRGDAEPSPEQFDTYDAYVKAQAKWEVRQELQAEQLRQRAFAEERAAESVMTEAQKRIDAFRTDHPDYDDVVNAVFLPATPAAEVIVAHLRHADVGPALAYELGQRPEELARIASLPPAFAIAALGKLEGQIESRAAAAQSGPALTPNVTKAKPPIKPVGGSPVTSDDGEVSDDLSPDEHIKRMNARDRARRRR